MSWHTRVGRIRFTADWFQFASWDEAGGLDFYDWLKECCGVAGREEGGGGVNATSPRVRVTVEVLGEEREP